MISTGLGIREDGGYLVITLRGEVDVADAARLAAALAVVVAGNPRVIADLAALEFIDCCALGVLVRVRVQARQAGGDLLLAAPRRQVRRILALTGLAGVFTVRASAEEAAAAAGWPRPGGHPRAQVSGVGTLLPAIPRWLSLIIKVSAAPDPGGLPSAAGSHHDSA